MKQPSSISELSEDKALRPMQRSNLMLVFLNRNQIENRECSPIMRALQKQYDIH